MLDRIGEFLLDSHMKKRAIWTVVPALALGLGACKKTEAPTPPPAAETPAPAAPDATAKPATETPAPAPAPKPSALSVEERAAKLGFAKHLPQDTEVVMSFHNGSKAVDRVKSSKLWKLVQSEMGMGVMDDGAGAADEEMDEDLPLPESEQDAEVPAAADADAADPADADDSEPVGPATLFGTEFTVALGKSTGAQTSNLVTAATRMNYFRMRYLTKAVLENAKSGDFSNMLEVLAEMDGEELGKNMASDPKSGVGLFEKMSMPPFYIAFRTTADQKAGAAQQLASLTEQIAMFGEEITEPAEVEKAGAKFAGQKIVGAKIAGKAAEDRSELDELLGKEEADKFLAAVGKKDLYVLSGTLGDYVVLFVGASLDDLKFAESPADSILAGDALAFCDPYASKDLAAFVYGQKEMLDQLAAANTGMSYLVEGLRDGMAGSEVLGDTRDLETLLRMVGEREEALRKLATNDALGIAAFFEEGLKIETYGGTDMGAADWKTPGKLASLGDSEDVLMFASMTSNAAYDEKVRAYGETLMETAYAITMKAADLKIESEELAQFKGMAQMFDTKFRPDLVAVWGALTTDLGAGLGAESAFVVDLKGAMPAVPGVPQPVVNEAKVPRISVIAPVTDRAKLSGAWEKLNTSATSILGKISEMTGQEIPMQKPISSEKDGLTTWFFSFPFFNDDFMPSVTVGDKWFAASTSKVQAVDLIKKADQSTATKDGVWFKMDFNTLRKYSNETVDVLEKNKEALGMGDEDLKQARKIIAATEDLDKLTVHARRENGKLRSSVHFKTH